MATKTDCPQIAHPRSLEKSKRFLRQHIYNLPLVLAVLDNPPTEKTTRLGGFFCWWAIKGSSTSPMATKTDCPQIVHPRSLGRSKRFPRQRIYNLPLVLAVLDNPPTEKTTRLGGFFCWWAIKG
ncbi:MAG: hypothetical protein J6L87_07165, partial [Clostridia bacterium]|nr:hypothetical protein [Clostridia bacterium]